MHYGFPSSLSLPTPTGSAASQERRRREPRFLCPLACALSLGVMAAACGSMPKPQSLTQMPTYEVGLQVFPSPRDFDPPGTVFRIDPDGVFRPIADLSGLLHLQPHEEVVPRVAVYRGFDIGTLFSWLGASSLGSKLERVDSAVVDVGGAEREQAFEVDLRRVVDSAARLIDWSKPGRVYVVTETVLADSVAITLGVSTRLAVGDSLKADSARARGVSVSWTPHAATNLDLKFSRPYRVFYKAEELRPSSRLEGDSIPKPVRIPVTQPLIWRNQTAP